MLPTWGVGLLAFVILAYLFRWINRIAMFASVIVFNPVVKWGVYAASMTLGFLLLGPVTPESADLSANTAEALVVRLLVGNLILAVVATVIAYVVVYRLVTRHRERTDEFVESVIDEIEDVGT